MSEFQIQELLRQFPFEPAWLLALIVALVYGTLFRLFWGRPRRSVVFYWLVAAGTMIMAQWLFGRAPLTDWSLGNLRIIEDSVACWVALFLANLIKL